MEKMNQVVEMARQSHHLPWVLSLLIGLFVIRKEQREYEDEFLGDNAPFTLIDSLWSER